MLVLLPAACTNAVREVPRDGALDYPEYMRLPSRAPSAEETVDSAPVLAWRAHAGRGSLGPVALGDRVAVVATVDRWVYALDARTGERLWRWHADAPIASGPVIGRGRVFVAMGTAEGRVVAIDLFTAKRRWQARAGDVAAPLVLADSTVYGTSQRGDLFALAAGNGKVRWRRRLVPVRSAPIVLRDEVAVVTLTDSLVVLDRATGRVRRRMALPLGSPAPPAVVDDSTVALSSPSGAVALVALRDGAIRWRRDTGTPVFGAPVVARDTVFALTNDCLLWSIPLAAPASADSVRVGIGRTGCTTVAPPVITRGGVLVATVGGELVYYDRGARRRIWSRSVHGELRQPPSLRNGLIVVMPTVGDVESYR